MTPRVLRRGRVLSLISSQCPGRCISCSAIQGDVGGVQQEALPGVGNYLNFVTRFLFGFGAAFLLPILLMILERAGIVTREQLAKSRRYAIVGVGRGRGGADAARRRLDADAAGAALRPLRVRDPGDPDHALARGAQSGPVKLCCG